MFVFMCEKKNEGLYKVFLFKVTAQLFFHLPTLDHMGGFFHSYMSTNKQWKPYYWHGLEYMEKYICSQYNIQYNTHVIITIIIRKYLK